jgi:chemotaxis family two-component system sensor kinase Cph1
MADPAEVPSERVDLSNCEREPIHIPGSIQPHGILLALNPQTLQVVQWSLNAPELLGVGAGSLPGRPISDLVDAATTVLLERVARDRTEAVVTALRTRFVSTPAADERLGVAHLYQGILIVEFESDHSLKDFLHIASPDSVQPVARRLRQSMAVLQGAATMEDLFRVLAREFRALSGFDRVMVYRFASDGHGEVVGEAKADHLESFFGLHYPATDIPAQARRLYTLNTLRLIANLNAPSVPIVPVNCPLHGRPLDLTYSAFRSVSPIHIEYLQNMGVAASMSISILKGNSLWGLIACHHDSPRSLPFELRAGCDLLGSMAGAYVTTREAANEVQETSKRRMLLSNALQTIARAESIGDGLRQASGQLLELTDSDGVAICLDGEVDVAGQVPSVDVIEQLRSRIVDQHQGDVYCTDQWTNSTPTASGLLMVRVGPEQGDALIFFRNEYSREVKWAGNPQKPAEMTENGIRLSPRKSFALWKETVSGRSREWNAVDQLLATELRAGLVVLVARRVADLVRLTEELKRVNADLNAFTYSASHDLKEPLRAVNQTLYFLEESLREVQNPETTVRLQALRQSTRRVEDLLEALLRLSRVGQRDLQLEESDLGDVASEAAEIVKGQFKDVPIQFRIGKLPRRTVDFLLLRDLFINLFTNAIKYNRSEVRQIEVFAESADKLPGAPPAARKLTFIGVRDNGIGIATKNFKAIFEVFRRLHLPGEFGGGSGAGLTISKKIVQRHGGVMWLESTDQGTTFYFTLSVQSDEH